MVRFNHKHGIDLANNADLVAHECDNNQIRRALGCDNVVYLPLKQLVRCCMESRTDVRVQGFEVGVFTGSYVTQECTEDAEIKKSRIDRVDSAFALAEASKMHAVVVQ